MLRKSWQEPKEKKRRNNDQHINAPASSVPQTTSFSTDSIINRSKSNLIVYIVGWRPKRDPDHIFLNESAWWDEHQPTEEVKSPKKLERNPSIQVIESKTQADSTAWAHSGDISESDSYVNARKLISRLSYRSWAVI